MANNMANKADKLIDKYKFILDKFIIPDLSNIVMNYMMNEFAYVNVKNNYEKYTKSEFLKSYSNDFKKGYKKITIEQVTDESMNIKIDIESDRSGRRYGYLYNHDAINKTIDTWIYHLTYSSNGFITCN